MTKKKKSSPKQQPSEDIPTADNKDIMVITGMKMKYIPLNVLDTTLLHCLIELRKSLKMLIWDSNGNYYLKINDLNIRELPGEIEFKITLTLWIKPFQNTTFKRMANKLLGIQFQKLVKYSIIIIYIYI